MIAPDVCEVCGHPPPLPYKNHQGQSDPNMGRCTGHAKELCITIGVDIIRSCPKLRGNPHVNPWATTPSPCVGCDPTELGRQPIIYYGDGYAHGDRSQIRAWRIIKRDGRFVWTRADLFDPQPRNAA